MPRFRIVLEFLSEDTVFVDDMADKISELPPEEDFQSIEVEELGEHGWVIEKVIEIEE